MTERIAMAKQVSGPELIADLPGHIESALAGHVIG